MEAASAVPGLVRFRKQNKPWKNNKCIDFLFENVFKWFLPETSISQQKRMNIYRPNLG